MRAITVRDEYAALKDFTWNLPRTFNREGTVIHNSRNVIKKIDTGHGTFVVKNFAGMYFFNRLAYSLFRKSKAARSYMHSVILNARGIMTPPHVSWMDCYSMGLLTQSYFVSVFSPYRTLEQILQFHNNFEPLNKKVLLQSLAQFAHKLHTNGIYHRDFSLGNILVISKPSGYDFVLLDLNRIKFCTIRPDDGLRNFTTLSLPTDDMNCLIAEYCCITGQNKNEAVESFWRYQKRKEMLRRIRRTIRAFTIGPLERLLKKSH